MRNVKRRLEMNNNMDGTTQFSDLPSCLVMDILLRLPIATLLTCICVCKDWIRLLRDSHFVKLQLAASPLHILNRHIGKNEIFQFGQFMEDKSTADLEVKILNLPTKLGFLNLPPSTGIYDYVCIDSCNGLVCLMDRSNCSVPFATSIRVFVCNPISGEWVSISTPVRKHPDVGNMLFATAMAFMFSAKNNQYKLLHGFQIKEEEYGFEIYTLGGTRQWRSIPDETPDCRPWMSSSPRESLNTISLHGSLHWSSSTIHADCFICCFDVDYEKFRKRISYPPMPSREEKFRREGKLIFNSRLQLGAINDCLCLVAFYGYDDNDHTDDVDIWVMKEYGVEESWGKMFTIPVWLSSPYLLFSLNEEEILMYDDIKSLVSYNLKRNTLKYCQPPPCLEKSYYFHFRIAYNPSFISLQDVAKGEEVILSRSMRVIQ